MKINIGSVVIGDGSPIAIQSMTNTDTRDVQKTVRQIHELCDAGVDIIRAAVPDMEACDAVSEIKKQIRCPLVCDIHFDYRLAIECVKNGADKIRINPGNIGAFGNVKKVADICKEHNVPIRIGVNSGSLPAEFKTPTKEAMVASAKSHIEILNSCDFNDIVISLKSSNTKLTYQSYQLFKEKFSYPLHLGITEAGTTYQGIIKSSVGIGSLLLMGIGDTIRVSLTADPIEEVKAANGILKAVGLKNVGAEVISCPTCGRTKIDLIKIANLVTEAVSNIKKPIKIAVMGCVVNGPGEAKEADIGIAGGDGCAVLFKKGEVVRKIKEDEIVSTLLNEIEKL